VYFVHCNDLPFISCPKSKRPRQAAEKFYSFRVASIAPAEEAEAGCFRYKEWHWPLNAQRHTKQTTKEAPVL
ncbi:MAG: hypothetical protein U5N85_06395, partial [Arcicella sp.]|nr:hypothetical protein [Arcicella sp.]